MQEELVTEVFQRTELASDTLRNTPNVVPLELRTLLLAVDGRSTVAQYLPFLPKILPLSPKFQALEDLGFLRRCEPSANSDANMNRSASNEPEKNAAHPSGAELDAHTLRAIEAAFGASAGQIDAAATTLFDEEIARLAAQMDSATKLHPTIVAPTSVMAAPVAPTLESLLAQMERFVAGQPDIEGLALVLMLDQIRSTQQLEQELDDYEKLLAPRGPVAIEHVRHLREQLRILSC